MMTEEQKRKERLIDLICLTCVDVRNVYSEDVAQDKINEVRALAEQLSALTQPASPALKLPDGWVAVPLEPTEEMIAAWRDDMDKSYAKEHAIKIGEDEIVFAHQAMLAAAPSVPHTAPIEPICATGGAEWVKCSNELPKKDGQYWGWWSEEKRQGPVWFIERQNQFQSYQITHWMPLPAAPKS